MKTIASILLALVLVICLAACSTSSVPSTSPTTEPTTTPTTAPTTPEHMHTWQDATCPAPKTCTNCGETEDEPAGHNYSGVVTEPTCTEQGYTTYTCLGCSDSYTADFVDPDGHDWQDATCKTPKACSVCGATTGSALGHTWDSGKIIHEATEEADGEILYTCNVCGATETRVVPALNHEHNYSTWWLLSLLVPPVAIPPIPAAAATAIRTTKPNPWAIPGKMQPALSLKPAPDVRHPKANR